MKNFHGLIVILSVYLVTGFLLNTASAQYSAKLHKNGPDQLVAESGASLNMKSGSAIYSNGSLPTPIASVAVPTANATPVGTNIWGAINTLENTQNQVLNALVGAGILPSPTPTPTNTPTATPTP